MKPHFTISHRWLPDGRLILSLPLPDRAVSPNAQRGNSRISAVIKSARIKAHRYRAWAGTKSAVAARTPTPAFAGYSLAFHWPTAAYRDDDNADASCKAYRDGIASALGMDDRHLRKLALSTHAKDKDHPRLEITLLPCTSPISSPASTAKASTLSTSSSSRTSPRKASTVPPRSTQPRRSTSPRTKSSPPPQPSPAPSSSIARGTVAAADRSATPSQAKA